MSRVELLRFPNADALADAAAGRWADLLAACEANRAWCVALPGGRIIGRVFDRFAAETRRRGLSLANVHCFWGDERCVPPDHAESNFASARRHLLQPLDFPDTQVHRIHGELPQAEAAELATAELRAVTRTPADRLPVLDLVLLGMGEDGHVASLFPETEPTGAVYRAVTGPKPPPQRVTLDFDVLAAARAVWILVSGAGKREALRDSLALEGRTPLARVLQMRDRTVVFADIDI